jgi:hypothetical protein
VTVVALEATVAPSNGDMPSPGKSLIPPRYNTVRTSGLRFAVEPGANRIDLPLKSP